MAGAPFFKLLDLAGCDHCAAQDHSLSADFSPTLSQLRRDLFLLAFSICQWLASRPFDRAVERSFKALT